MKGCPQYMLRLGALLEDYKRAPARRPVGHEVRLPLELFLGGYQLRWAVKCILDPHAELQGMLQLPWKTHDDFFSVRLLNGEYSTGRKERADGDRKARPVEGRKIDGADFIERAQQKPAGKSAEGSDEWEVPTREPNSEAGPHQVGQVADAFAFRSDVRHIASSGKGRVDGRTR